MAKVAGVAGEDHLNCQLELFIDGEIFMMENLIKNVLSGN